MIRTETEIQKQNVAASSVAASLLLTGLKLAVGLLTGSIGILSEAAHSALDLGAATITLFAVRVSDRPADTEHQYGHGKVESFSALAETVLLFITSGWIIYEAVKRLVEQKTEIEVTWYAFAVMIISVVVDVSRSTALYRVARRTNSQALEADALHFRTDIWSSSVVILGLIFVTFGISGADAFAAMGVALFVVYAGYQLGRRTVDVLLDTAPKGLAERLREIVDAVDGVVTVERLRLRTAGAAMFVETTVAVSRTIPLEQMREITGTIQERIRQEAPRADVVVDVKPVALGTETIVEQIQVTVANHGLAAHDIRVHTQDGGTSINFDLEVEEGLTLGQAHEQATHIERTLEYEFGPGTRVNIHIEPLRPAAVTVDRTGDEETAAVNRALESVRRQLPVIRDIHGVTVERVGDKLFISVHCVLDDQIPLVDAHDYSSKIEYLMKDALPGVVERVVVHLEPVPCGEAEQPADGQPAEP